MFLNIFLITSAVKISTLTHVIYFSSLTALKIFHAINAGAELGSSTQLTTAASVSFFLDKNCVYLNAERLFDLSARR